jgi:hypothetical protein
MNLAQLRSAIGMVEQWDLASGSERKMQKWVTSNIPDGREVGEVNI